MPAKDLDLIIATVLDEKCGLKFPAEYYDAVDPNDFRQVYLAGIKEALRLYAWWKDGVQYVGTTGTTLKQALEDWGIE